MSNWKKYGGIYNMDNNNNVSVYSLVADLFTLRQSYFGTFDICGEMHVSGNSTIDSNLKANNITVLNDLSTNRLYVNDITKHYNDVDITGNLLVDYGNVYILTNLSVQGVIKLENQLYLGNSGNAYLFGTDIIGNVGLNTTTPIAAFDISSSKPLAFNVGTSVQEKLYSIPVQNKTHRGIVLAANTIASQIAFFNDTILSTNTNTADGTISYLNGGFLTIDVSQNTNILSKLSISNRTNNVTSHLMGETTVIYDTSSGPYLQPVYQNATETTGSALSLIANDSSSNTFMNIITPNKQGISIGGGVYPNDQMRSMGTIGWQDTNANYTPSLNIVSGKSNVRQKTTVGINTHAPTTESYAFDVNGPIHIKNGELTITKQANMEIRCLAVGKTAKQYAVAIGSPYTTTAPYRQKIIYTNNGGETWNENYDLYDDTIEDQIVNFNAAFVFDQSLTIIGGDRGYAYYTYNGYNNNSRVWKTIITPFNSNYYSIKSIYLTPSKRVFFGIDLLEDGRSFIYSFNMPTVPSSGFSSTDGIDSSLNLPNNPLFYGIKSMDGCGNTLWVAVGKNIINVDTSSSIYTTSRTTTVGNYNTISVLDQSNIIAAGNNIISFTTNGGTNWTDLTLNIPIINQISILDTSNAIAVCNNGTILATSNWQSGDSWIKLSNSELNVSGNANRLNDPSYNLTNIGFIDSNNFYITKNIQSYGISKLGNTSLFHVYLPNLFNNITNYVLDVSGSFRLSGDMNVNDGGKIASNNQTFKLLNDRVNQIYFGGDASNVYIGSLKNSTVVVNSNLNVINDSVLNGNLNVKSNTTVVGTLYITGNTFLSNLVVNANANVYGTLTATGNTLLQSNLVVKSNTTVIGNLSVTGNTFLSNLVVNSNANVYRTFTVTGNTLLQSNLVVNSNTTVIGNLSVTGNTFMSNLVVNSNTIVIGNLSVTGNTSVANLIVGSSSTLSVFGNIIYSNVYLNQCSNITASTTLTYPLYSSYNITNTNATSLSIILPTIVNGQKIPGATINFFKSGNSNTPVVISSVGSDLFVTNGETTKNSTFLIPGGTTSATLISSFDTPNNYWTGIGGGGGGSINGNLTVGGVLKVTGNSTLGNLTFYNTTTSGQIYDRIFLDDKYNNFAVGENSLPNGNELRTTQTGTPILNSISIGKNSMKSITSGYGDTVSIGIDSIKNAYLISGVSSIGYQSLINVTDVARNTVSVGCYSMNDYISTSYNTAIGFCAGGINNIDSYSGSYNTLIGSNTGSSIDCNFSTAIGANAKITANNQIMLGTSVETVVIPGKSVIGGVNPAVGYILTVGGSVQASSYNATSDRRLKSNIRFLSNQSKSILDVVPVTFDWKVDGRHDIGFIAQNIYETYPELRPKTGIDPSSNIEEPTDSCGNPIYYAIDYGRMTPFLWQGMREIIQRIDALELENRDLKYRLEILERNVIE